MAEQQEDFSSLPLLERFVHKNWKVRKEAYEETAKSFEITPDESAADFKPFLQDPGLWKGAVADSNVVAQQEGIAALCAFLKYGGKEKATRYDALRKRGGNSDQDRTRGSTVALIVEKGLPSSRAATKQGALEALLLYVELDKADPIIDDLLPALANKQPKIIAAALTALRALYHAYGVRIVDPKAVLKALPKVFGHADKNVRAEATSLVVELYRWLKEAIKTLFWNDLKPVQQQDLEKLFEAVRKEPPPKQERLLRTQQVAQESAGAAVEEVGAAVDEPAEIDVFELAEPVDVLSKIPKTFYEQVASTKWKDRKDALDEFYALAKTDRIKEGSFDEVVSALAKCMKDANVAVVMVAANSVEALARGLRKSFGRYRPRIMPPMLERCKEKKPAVADALGAALDAVFASSQLSDCLDEILEFMKNKNPQIKLETVRFLIRCLKTTPTAPSTAEVKSIADAAIKLLTESTEVTRSSGAEVLGTLMKIMGERPMAPFLDGLDDIRKAKIQEYLKGAEVKAKYKPKAAAAPPPKVPSTPASKKVMGGKKVVAKKPAAAATPRAASPLMDIPTPKPAARAAIPSKVAAPPRSGLIAPSGTLKLQKKLAGPGGAAPLKLSSPRRNMVSPTSDEGAAPPAPRIGLGGPGLASRPLARPSSTTTSDSVIHTTSSTTLTPLEHAELDELRAANDRLSRTAAQLHADKARLDVEINALRTHEAELIEERTRNRLTIKAKETQLVRARSDAEAAEDTVVKQQKEIERLKRELGRAFRATSPPELLPAPLSSSSHHHADHNIYRDGVGSNSSGGGGGGGSGGGVNALSTAPANAIVSGVDRYESNRASREIGYQRARSYMTSPSEEKENGGLDLPAKAMGSPSPRFATSAAAAAAIGNANDLSDGSRGASPARQRAVDGSGATTATGEPIESWKRAAEVTSQLKARIEQMKARQGLSRPQQYQ